MVSREKGKKDVSEGGPGGRVGEALDAAIGTSVDWGGRGKWGKHKQTKSEAGTVLKRAARQP